MSLLQLQVCFGFCRALKKSKGSFVTARFISQLQNCLPFSHSSAKVKLPQQTARSVKLESCICNWKCASCSDGILQIYAWLEFWRWLQMTPNHSHKVSLCLNSTSQDIHTRTSSRDNSYSCSRCLTRRGMGSIRLHFAFESPWEKTRNHTIVDRSPPGLVRTAPSAVHLIRRCQDATSASLKFSRRDDITIGTWNTRTQRAAGKLKDTIVDRSPPGLTRTVTSAVHQYGGVKRASSVQTHFCSESKRSAYTTF